MATFFLQILDELIAIFLTHQFSTHNFFPFIPQEMDCGSFAVELGRVRVPKHQKCEVRYVRVWLTGVSQFLSIRNGACAQQN
jgi:hypothetical protein